MADTVFHLNRVDSPVGPIALVTVDNGEDYRKPTTLGRSAFESAVSLIDQLENGNWAAMVVTGKPFVFCVGADIDEFTRSVRRSARTAGHDCSAVRALPFPTMRRSGAGGKLSCITGARTIASNVRHVGFPEVALSIIPAWGGTQLAPRLVGPEAAAKLIVLNPLRQNKLLTAPEAFELGLADRLLAPVEFLDESLQFAVDLVRDPLQRTDADWSELQTVLRKARSRVDDAVHGATRAPYVALDLIEGAEDWSIEDGYAAEEQAMAELMLSPQAQASAYAFTVVERRTEEGRRPPDVAAPRAERSESSAPG